MVYPNYYPQYQAPQYQAQMPTQAQNTQAMQPQVQAQMQTNGLISVHNEQEAKNYPIAVGNSITFKDENAPYIYTKTMGFSQLDRPTFEKYRLVKEDVEPQKEVLSAEADNTALDELKAEIEDVRCEIEALKKKLAPRKKAKEDEDDE